MIGITRPETVPSILLTRGVSERLFARGNVKSEIYAHVSVRESLDGAHRAKCCYCESIVSLDVEHFRPKNHYYWLAYEWSNLLLACRKCNELKGTKFPLEIEEHRALSQEDDCSRELPLFLDPATDSPEAHIEWHDEVARGTTTRGRETVQRLLNRKDLVKARWERLRIVKHFVALVNSRDPVSAVDAQRGLTEMCADGASFSAMIRAYARRITPSAASPTE
jgi:uncharacterized protein (TIGR02646 family)